MSNRPDDDSEVWENLVVFVVLGGLAVFGYHKVKPMVEGWLKQHDVVHLLGSISVDRILDIAAAIIGLLIVLFLVQAWRRVRGRGRKGRRVW